jgi:hypothetical protein
MTPQQLVGLGVRLVAVWFAISSIRYLSSVPLYLVATNEVAERVYQAYIVAAAYLIAALLLWFFPLTIAHKLIPRTQYNDTLRIQYEPAAHVGCALVGLWLLTKSLPGFFGTLLSLVLNDLSFRELASYSQVEFGVYAFEILISAFLIFRAKVFARLIARDQDTAQAHT